jgi:hypothetical protein
MTNGNCQPRHSTGETTGSGGDSGQHLIEIAEPWLQHVVAMLECGPSVATFSDL